MSSVRAPCCRIAKQVSIFYNDVSRALDRAPLNTHFDKSWPTHTTAKTQLYEAEALIQVLPVLWCHVTTRIVHGATVNLVERYNTAAALRAYASAP